MSNAVSSKTNKPDFSAKIQNHRLLQKRHEQIVEAASALFSRKGYHMTTMRNISEACGISLAQLYHYINTKDDILYLFYESIYKRLVPIYDAVELVQSENPLAQLKTLIFSQLQLINESGDKFLTMYTESRHLKKSSLKAVLASEAELVERLEGIIKQGIADGLFKECDTWMVANIIQYLLMIEPLRGWNTKSHYSFSDFSNSLIRFIMNMLGAEDQP